MKSRRQPLNVNVLEHREVPAAGVIRTSIFLVPTTHLTTTIIPQQAIHTEGNASTKPILATIYLSEPSAKPVTVEYSTIGAIGGNGFTATSGSDFIFQQKRVTFAPGQTQQTVSYLIKGDVVHEADEVFGIQSAIVAVGSTSITNSRDTISIASVTIANDDLVPLKIGFNQTNYASFEGNPGDLKSVQVVVSLNRPANVPVTVKYGPSVKTTDFLSSSGQITFAPGETSKVITLTIKPDTQFEGDENIGFQLFGQTSGTLATANMTVTILNDDAAPPPRPRFTNFVSVANNTSGGMTWTNARPGQASDLPINFGLHGDIAVMGDWNQDGRSDMGVARPNAATGLMDWYLDLNNDGYLAEKIVSFGFNTDTPLVGDVDGNGLSDLIVVRANVLTGNLDWFVDLGCDGYNGETATAYGKIGDRPIVGDWNRDGQTDFGVVRNINGTMQWLLDYSSSVNRTPEEVFYHGAWTDRAIVGDWNNDGFSDIGLARPRTDGQLQWLIDVNNDRGVDVSYTFGKVNDQVITGYFH